MDTNPLQFERQGNPWHGEGELRVKRGRRKRRVPTCRAATPRLAERSARAASEAFVDIRADAKLLRELRAMSGKSRTLAPVAEPLERGIVSNVKPPRSAELSRWSQFERLCRKAEQQRAFNAKREAAECAYQASEAAKAAERRRLQALIAATEARLATL